LYNLNLVKPPTSIPNSLSLDPELPIRAFSWHPYKQMFAVGLRNDCIYIYDLTIEAWLPIILKHEFQKSIYCIEWKPQSGGTLAVGCLHGICIWSISRENLPGISKEEKELQNPWMNYFHYPGHSPVTTLSWSPNGRYLSSGSPNDSGMIIWDVAFEVPNVIRRYGGITILRWSPNGQYLFAGTTHKIFRIWETQTWTCQKWSSVSSHVQTVAWSPDGDVLAITSVGESVFYCISFSKSPPSIDGFYVRSDDIGSYKVISKISGDEINVGGPIKEICWDNSGERLAITFLGNDLQNGTDLIALYSSKLIPFLDFTPRGFIKGPPTGEKAELLSFRPNFSRGALLAACWRNGKISFYPMYFPKESK